MPGGGTRPHISRSSGHAESHVIYQKQVPSAVQIKVFNDVNKTKLAASLGIECSKDTCMYANKIY